MDWSHCPIVETDPLKVSGAPVLHGTRVPADAVVDNFDSGSTVEEIAYNFDLDPGTIREVLAFAHRAHPTPSHL